MSKAKSHDADQRALIARLADPAFHGPHCRAVRIVETHISYVVLTGTFAYKIKKAVDLGFVDFTTPAARRFFCHEEIRLNRRLAPSLYLDVIDITGTPDQPRFDRGGTPFEYAVRMREFPQHALLSAVLARGELTGRHVDRLAVTIGTFHQSASIALPHTRFGTPADIEQLAAENFVELERLNRDPVTRRALHSLRLWSDREYGRLADVFVARRHHGYVRECHGDLHLGNIALIDDVATPFDCIEFNERMRWSDVASDVAFLVMDLQARGRADLGNRFLNQYLDETGDHDGLTVLRFFIVYRALVRAKVASLRAAQTSHPQARAGPLAEAVRLLRIALDAARGDRAGVVITHGLSGSGKTSVASAIANSTSGIHIRSDVERKRLFGVPRLARTGSTIASGIYSDAATRRTYDRLAALTRIVSTAGYVAIVDGAFLKRWQRERLQSLASAAALPFAIVDCEVPVAILLERLAARGRRRDDASEADAEVLAHQIETAEPLDASERTLVVPCDTTRSGPESVPAAAIADVKNRLISPATPAPSARDISPDE